MGFQFWLRLGPALEMFWHWAYRRNSSRGVFVAIDPKRENVMATYDPPQPMWKRG
jgi:hypothetical protein